MKCWPFGDPWACTTATWAVTCWLFWLSPFDSATRICESLESEDSRGTTSITLTLPDGAVWRIIFFCRRKGDFSEFPRFFPQNSPSPDLDWRDEATPASVASFAVHQTWCWLS
jgi:hypothetical protein